MRAMVLAAGLGTRLRPLTNDRPKALVEIAGRTLLEITLTRLSRFGIRDIILNTHHFSEQIADYLAAKKNFGLHIEISHEEVLLDTGGGLKQAAYFFRDQAQPFILHNVDVVSDIDLKGMLDFHIKHNPLATLAVQKRESSRYLLFDDAQQLCGRKSLKESKTEIARPCANPQAFAFCGIHVISPRLLAMLTESGAFSIVSSYLRLAKQGENIQAFPADHNYWRDLGTPEAIRQADAEVSQQPSV